MPKAPSVRTPARPIPTPQGSAPEGSTSQGSTPHEAGQAFALAPPRLFVGTSGWDYPTWKPGFYPAELTRRQFLGFYGTELNSCEVNYTFRKLPLPATVEGWLRQTPPGFRFSFKAPQRITHFSRLRGCEAHVEEFLAVLRPVAEAGRLGTVLFQLPPNLQADPALLREFLALPPLRGPDAPPLAFEFRHDSWFCAETEQLLCEAGAAFCIAETDDLRTPELHPAPAHTSFRLRQGGGYTPAELRRFVERILPLTTHRDVYVYFKHEEEPTGALNARAFLQAAVQAARPEQTGGRPR